MRRIFQNNNCSSTENNDLIIKTCPGINNTLALIYLSISTQTFSQNQELEYLEIILKQQLY